MNIYSWLKLKTNRKKINKELKLCHNSYGDSYVCVIFGMVRMSRSPLESEFIHSDQLDWLCTWFGRFSNGFFSFLSALISVHLDDGIFSMPPL